MRRVIVGLVMLSGCSLYWGDGSTSPVAEPRVCTKHITLQAPTGDSNSQRLTVDESGVDLCMHVDTSKMFTPQFMVSSVAVPGPSTGLEMTLEDAAFVPLVDGADSTDHSGPATTSMDIQMLLSPGARDLVLWVRARDVHASANLLVSTLDLDL